jgi:CBS domain-containing protein
VLTKHRIGALVVLGAGGRLAGILSERDIVRAIAESGITVRQLPVAQVMTRNVFTCDVNDSINSVIERMTKANFAICRCSTTTATPGWYRLATF